MSWRMLGEVILTADMSGTPRVYQKLIPTHNSAIKAIRTYFINYNNAAFTAVGLKIYCNNAGVPKALIATASTVTAKASLFTENYGVIETYFNFDPHVMVRSGETYHVVPYLTGYTGTNSSHIAWKHSYPDPAYQTSVDMSFEGQAVSPFDLSIISARL